MSRPQPTSDDDTDLVLRVGEGDARAYHELCSRHAARLRAFVMRLVRNDADADDIVQETFLRLWLRAGDYERRARFVDLALPDRPQSRRRSPAREESMATPSG